MEKQSASRSEQAPTSTIYSYYVLLVLTLVYMFSTVDRTLISVLAEPIKAEFGLSDGQLGLLTGLAFAISYSIAGIPLGLLVDRVRRATLLASLVTIWSGLTFLSGMATSAIALALARIGVGASEAGASPASMSMITDYFPKERRGLALSIFYMSTPIGVALTFSIGGAIAAAHGWHVAFFVAGGPGLVLASLIFFTVREPIRGRFDPVESAEPAEHGEAPERHRLRRAVGTLLSIRPLLYLLLAAVCVVIAQAGLGAFFSPFLIRVHEMSVAEAGYAIGAVKGPTGIIGLLAGGLVADQLAKRSLDGGIRIVGILMALAAAFAIATVTVPSWTLALALTGCFNFLNYTYYGATFATYMTLAPVRMRGTLAGIFAVAMTMIGYGFGPPLAGLSSDLFASLGVVEPLRWALVVTASFFALGGLIFLRAAAAIKKLEHAGSGDHPAP